MTDPPQSDFRRKSDRELFELIQVGGRSSPASAAAFSELHRRYAPALFRHGSRTYPSQLKCEDDVREFVQRVFVDFWTSGVMLFDRSLAKTTEDMTRLVHCWLNRSGKNIIMRWRREMQPDRRPVSLTVIGLTAEAFESPQEAPTDKDAVTTQEWLDAALAPLTPRERDVVLTCTAGYEPHTRNCRVSREVKQRLMHDHDFQSWDTVRQCLKRTLQKLRESLNEKATVA